MQEKTQMCLNIRLKIAQQVHSALSTHSSIFLPSSVSPQANHKLKVILMQQQLESNFSPPSGVGLPDPQPHKYSMGGEKARWPGSEHPHHQNLVRFCTRRAFQIHVLKLPQAYE